MTTVPPIIANVPAPMEISAISRMISRRKCTAACGTPASALHIEQHVVADAAQHVAIGRLNCRVSRGYVDRRIVMVPIDVPGYFVVIRMPMAVTTTLITNNAMNAYTTVSLTALPTALAPPPVMVRPR